MNATKLIITMLLAAFSAVATAADTRISERRPAAADGVVEVSNVAGSVRLVGWRRNEVEVEGTLAEGVERVEFTGDGGNTRIRVHLVRRNGRVDGDANLVIRVPQRSRMRVTTVSADVAAEGLDGPVELKSVSGGIDAAGGYTEADLQSVSGTVRVRSSGPDARVTASSISGLVQVDAMRGELSGNTVSGTVRVTSGGLSRVSMRSVSGDVVFEGPLANDGVYDIESVSGSARVVAEGRVNARFELETFNGSIRNAFGPEPARTSQYAPGRELRFEEGDGGAQVRMRSMSGTIYLQKK